MLFLSDTDELYFGMGVLDQIYDPNAAIHYQLNVNKYNFAVGNNPVKKAIELGAADFQKRKGSATWSISHSNDF